MRTAVGIDGIDQVDTTFCWCVVLFKFDLDLGAIQVQRLNACGLIHILDRIGQSIPGGQLGGACGGGIAFQYHWIGNSPHTGFRCMRVDGIGHGNATGCRVAAACNLVGINIISSIGSPNFHAVDFQVIGAQGFER